mmetsp:Transcript_19524/g.30006  ORF Transcript_19524/g.30006 Transcript_19524/m.30006 type:complete len:142 (+) Transcript_19524:2376-2801(+)
MDKAQNFFLNLRDSRKESDYPFDFDVNSRTVRQQYFEPHIAMSPEVEEKLAKGLLWKGKLKTNPRFKHRAFVSIDELKVDVLISQYRLVNRAVDGDTVLIELMPAPTWVELADQNAHHANVTSLDPATGKKFYGIQHLKKL